MVLGDNGGGVKEPNANCRSVPMAIILGSVDRLDALALLGCSIGAIAGMFLNASGPKGTSGEPGGLLNKVRDRVDGLQVAWKTDFSNDVKLHCLRSGAGAE